MQEILKKSLACYGKGKYKTYRIPGIIVTSKGTILAYCETRLGRSDWSTRGVGLFRSEDNGETWSEMKMIAQTDKEEAINNPIMISCKNGDVVFMWQTDYHRGFCQVSKDDGRTFSEAVEITDDLDAFRTQRGYPWKVIAFGPGHGIELSDGRLLVAVWLANGGKDTDHCPSVVSTITSEDGIRWSVGEIIDKQGGLENPNETVAIELSDKSVLLNIRHMSKTTFRSISISSDGLNNFTTPYFDKTLPDPVCFGSICEIPRLGLGGLNAAVFSNCATRPCRENFFSRERKLLTLRLSRNDCKSWKYSRLLEERSGYSDVAVSADGKWIYCFYEHDVDEDIYSEPRYLTFARVNIEWLTDGLLE